MRSKKICAIVGMGPGISSSVARRFGKQGFELVLVSRSEENLKRYQKALDKMHISSQIRVANAYDPEKLKLAITELQKEVGTIDVLIYNAAVISKALPSEVNPQTLIEEFKVNVAGALAAAQAVIPDMKKKKSGTILLTGGGLALEPYPIYTSLAIGKAGIRNLTFSLAGELEPYKIHVATVTIRGMVKKGTRFDPDQIAEEYWNLYKQGPGKFKREVIYE